MKSISSLNPHRVFYYFEEISKIPRGSGNCEKISLFCEDFARSHNLSFHRDRANNVIIYKSGTEGYENSEPIILQGHLDMVCQKTPSSCKDFEKEGIELYTDGDFLRAKDTTLGGDDGIAVAMILSVLESKEISHPPIEAIFTTDEEIGMLGAMELDFSKIRGRKMINLDSEEQAFLTVSCAGGSDFKVTIPCTKTKVRGERVKISIKGLRGGHSGVMIGSGRVNADILAGRLLHYARKIHKISLVDICGGDKGNAIPLSCTIELVCQNLDGFSEKMKEYISLVTKEISDREPDVKIVFDHLDSGEFSVVDEIFANKLIDTLVTLPNGVVEMSATIENLVETSLNLGILNIDGESITLHYTLRSNKMSAMEFLEERMKTYADGTGLSYEAFGHYPAWEYKKESVLQGLYCNIYKNITGEDVEVCAIHAGLECGIFASNIKDLDCISIGPDIKAIHTTDEALSISSTNTVYEILLEMLRQLK